MEHFIYLEGLQMIEDNDNKIEIFLTLSSAPVTSNVSVTSAKLH